MLLPGIALVLAVGFIVYSIYGTLNRANEIDAFLARFQPTRNREILKQQLLLLDPDQRAYFLTRTPRQVEPGDERWIIDYVVHVTGHSNNVSGTAALTGAQRPGSFKHLTRLYGPNWFRMGDNPADLALMRLPTGVNARAHFHRKLLESKYGDVVFATTTDQAHWLVGPERFAESTLSASSP